MILIIDDDATIRTSLTFILERNGYEPLAVAGPQEAMNVVRSQEPELVLMDMNYSASTDGEEGLTLLRQVKIFRPDTPVILMTAWGSIDLAVQGMRFGAFDFITKPWNNGMLLQRIETALKLAKDKKAPATFEEDEDNESWRQHIIGRSPALKSVLETIRRIASTNASVLILGESGTGKELIAEAIHNLSERKTRPFIKVNLGGISQSLFESEMFGHKKGSFTGAIEDHAGRFEAADGGTIFLDEIGELDLSCQVKLLRVLQDQTYERLGESETRRTDVRVVSATNAPLSQMVRDHTFREDLMYRLNLITIQLPPLRERPEDISLLVRHFLKPNRQSASPEAIRFLQTQPFPGNIRELKNLVERASLLSKDKEVLGKEDFIQAGADPNPKHPDTIAISGDGTTSQDAPAMVGTLDDIERQAILQTYQKFEGNISLMAEALGISRGALYRRMEKHGIN